MTAPGGGARIRHAGLLLLLALFGLAVVGRLALAAWIERPVPTRLPEVGATTAEARPFCLIVLDGLRDAVAWDTEDPCMPWLQAFARLGAWGVAWAGDPTLTAPCVRAILTGRAPDLVTSFRNFDMDPVPGTILGYLAERGARLVHGGDAAIYQMCRPYIASEDAFAVPDQGPTDFGTDVEAEAFVLEKIAEGADVVSMHLTRPDHTGHLEGADGEAYREACRIVDGQVRRVVEAFLEKNVGGLVLVCADHGATPTGTHGGGEIEARRALFALVGEGVVRTGPVEISQYALAPTVAGVLGLPLPPLADAPPAAELLDLPRERVLHVMDAYVQARLVVARSLGVESVDPIERRRAEVALDRLAGDLGAPYRLLAERLNRVLNPSALGPALLALLAVAVWIAALVRLGSVPDVPAGGARLLATLLLLGGVPVAFFVPVGMAAAVLLVASVAAALLGRPADRRGPLLATVALAVLAVTTAAGLALSTGWQASAAAGVGSGRIALALGAMGLLLSVGLRPRGFGARLADGARVAPGLLPALGGMGVGFLLTLRPFVNPLIVDYRIPFTLLGLGVLWGFLRSDAARAASRGLRFLVGALGVLLLVPPRVADVLLDGSWLESVARRDTAWLLLGAALVVLVPVGAPRARIGRRDLIGLLLAGLALVLAYVVRLDPAPGPLAARGAVVAGVAALLMSVGRGSPDGRFLVRLLAAAALGRRFTALDGEFAAYALFLVGAAVAARVPMGGTRRTLAWTAVGLLLLRTAVHHAMGGVESFSTVDVAGGFVGLEARSATAATDGGGVTWPIVEAAIQLALRFALPWIVMLAVVDRAGGSRAGTRRVLGDLALAYAARGAAITVVLWGWWRSAWWTEQARAVFALGAADLALLGMAALLVGTLWPRGARADAGGPR